MGTGQDEAPAPGAAARSNKGDRFHEAQAVGSPGGDTGRRAGPRRRPGDRPPRCGGRPDHRNAGLSVDNRRSRAGDRSGVVRTVPQGRSGGVRDQELVGLHGPFRTQPGGSAEHRGHRRSRGVRRGEGDRRGRHRVQAGDRPGGRLVRGRVRLSAGADTEEQEGPRRSPRQASRPAEEGAGRAGGAVSSHPLSSGVVGAPRGRSVQPHTPPVEYVLVGDSRLRPTSGSDAQLRRPTPTPRLRQPLGALGVRRRVPLIRPAREGGSTP